MPSPDWLWSLALGPAVRAVSLAREAELLLVRLDDHTLALVTTRGDVQARTSLPGIVAACISDDGAVIAAAGSAGQVWRLAPDLRLLSDLALAAPAVAIATDPFGQRLAVSDRQAHLHLIASSGREIACVQSPRPIHHLAFVPEQPVLAAAADLSWAGMLDLNSHQWLWSDRPVSNIGALAVAGSGDPVLLACFSDGLRRYGPVGQLRMMKPAPSSCGLVALSYSGSRAIAGGAAPSLYGFDIRGELAFTRDLDQPPTSLALSALGDRALVGQSNGKLTALRLPGE